jgi:hypothetical protein
MSYITETYLSNFRYFTEGLAYKSRYVELSKSDAQVKIFLSHSHKDRDFVEGLINALAYFSEISIYVDWQDTTMPRVTNRETAQRIKKRIGEMDCFLVLATKNAMESKWVPWEIGIADTTLAIERIAIIPVADPYGNFYGNEYLQLYQTIEITENKSLGVFPPNTTRGPIFKSWLSQQMRKQI